MIFFENCDNTEKGNEVKWASIYMNRKVEVENVLDKNFTVEKSILGKTACICRTTSVHWVGDALIINGKC